MGIDNQNIKLRRKKRVECSIVSIGNKVKITPDKDLLEGKKYYISCSSDLKNIAGDSIEEFNIPFATIDNLRVSSFRFTKATSSVTIRIIFTKDVDTDTLSFISINGNSECPYSINFITSKVIDITTEGALEEGVTYVLTVPVKVKDSEGKALAEEASYSFTWTAVLPLSIINTIPANGTIAASASDNIEVDFNNNIDESTMNENSIWLESIDIFGITLIESCSVGTIYEKEG